MLLCFCAWALLEQSWGPPLHCMLKYLQCAFQLAMIISICVLISPCQVHVNVAMIASSGCRLLQLLSFQKDKAREDASSTQPARSTSRGKPLANKVIQTAHKRLQDALRERSRVGENFISLTTALCDGRPLHRHPP